MRLRVKRPFSLVMVPDLNALSGKERSTTFAKGRGEPADSFIKPDMVIASNCAHEFVMWKRKMMATIPILEIKQ
jgi:hypothetical protein